MSASAGIALFAFFLPLVTIRVPIVGEIDFSGYKIFRMASELRERSPIKEVKVPAPSKAERPTRQRGERAGQRSEADLPMSIRAVWLAPVMVSGSFLCALLTALLSRRNVRTARLAAGVGGLLGVLVIVHVMVINADFHAAMQKEIRRMESDLKDNPFAALGTALVSGVASAFEIKPGIGIYVLVICLGIAAVLGQTAVSPMVTGSQPATTEQSAEKRADSSAKKVPVGMKLCTGCGRIIIKTAVRCIHCGRRF